MHTKQFLSTLSPLRLVNIAGVIAVASGLLFWGLQPWKMQEQTTPDSPQILAVPATATAVDKWFAPGVVRMNVTVQGIMVRRDRAVALLSVNDGAAEPYMVGDNVLTNVQIRTIDATGVVLERAGESLSFPAPEIPQPPADLIVPVAETQ